MKYLLLTVLTISPAMSFDFGKSVAKAPKTETVRLSRANTVIFDQELTPVSVQNAALAFVGRRVTLDPEKTMYILIASNGGQYESAVFLLEFINTLPNTKLVCRFCASGAALVFGGATIPRLAFNKTILIMHEMYQDHVTAKQISDKAKVSALVEASHIFNTTMAHIVKLPLADYEKKIEGTEWVVTSDAAVFHHLADKFVAITCTDDFATLAPKTCSQ